MNNFENNMEIENYEIAQNEPETSQEIKTITPNEVYNWIKKNNLFKSPSAMKIAALLGGDRLSCTDEAVTIMDKEDKKIVGVATIAPEGEELSGHPTIVGEFILPEYRGQGLGKKLFIKTLERCKERGFKSIRVDIMSNKIGKIIENLQKDDKWSNYIIIGLKDTILDLFQG